MRVGSSQMRIGEHLAAEDLRVGDAVDRLQARLDDAREIVGDLRGGHHLRVEVMYMSAKPCPVCLTTTGSLASRGSRPRT